MIDASTTTPDAEETTMTANEQTYSSKATAKRGATRMGLSDGQYELVEQDGRWIIELNDAEGMGEDEELEGHRDGAEALDEDDGEDIDREAITARIATLQAEIDALRDVLATEQLVPLVVSATVSPCQKVRLIADSMLGERRKDIIAKCVAKGVSPNTAKTQYQLWFVATSGGAHTYYEYDEQGNVLGKWGEVDGE